MLSSRPSNSASASSSLPWSRRSSASATGVWYAALGMVSRMKLWVRTSTCSASLQRPRWHSRVARTLSQWPVRTKPGPGSRSMMPRWRKVALHDATRSKSAV